MISDATKPRISFSLRRQPFNSSIGQRRGYGFLSGMFFVCWRYSRSFDRIKGSVQWCPVQLFYFGAISDRLQIGVPVSCFSFSDRVSVADRRSFEARLSSPDRFSSLPIVVSVGCRESCWIAQDYRTKAAGRLGYPGRLVRRVLGHLGASSAFSGYCRDCFIFPSVGKITMVGRRFNGVKTAFLLDEDPFNGTTGNVG